MPRYNFTYPTIPDSEDAFFDVVCSILRPYRLSKDLWHRVMLVLSETFTNAYLHGNQKRPETTIKVALNVNEKELSVDIIDEGVGGGSIDKIKNKKPSTTSMENGRGIDLVRHYADSVAYSLDEKGGCKVSITLLLKKEQDIKI